MHTRSAPNISGPETNFEGGHLLFSPLANMLGTKKIFLSLLKKLGPLFLHIGKGPNGLRLPLCGPLSHIGKKMKLKGYI